jgi:hypothetical protein
MRYLKYVVIVILFLVFSGCMGKKGIFNPENCTIDYGGSIKPLTISECEDEKRINDLASGKKVVSKASKTPSLKKEIIVKKKKPTNISKVKKWDDAQAYNKIKNMIVADSNLKNKLDDVFWFMAKNFGSPVVNGKIKLVIDDSYNTTARMSLKKRSKVRKIYIKEFDLYATEQHVIVHELFHGLYQDNNMILKYPDMVIEGMAVFAQNMYRLKTTSSVKVANYLKQEHQSMGCIVPYFDFSSSFGVYKKGCVLDKAYLVAGYLVASQVNAKNKVLEVIHGKTNTDKNFYNFVVKNKINMKKLLSLVNRDFKKYTNGMFESNPTKIPTVYVSNTHLNLRSASKASATLKKKLKAFEMLRVIAHKNGWLKVVDKDRGIGWVSKSYVKSIK